MSRVVAGIHAGPAARPVLDVALALGRLLSAEVEAIHVREGPIDAATALADRYGVPLRILSGDPAAALLQVLSAPDVALGVLGCRDRPSGTQPAGHIALSLVTATAKPVVVVPPESVACPTGRIRRALVPLDGSLESSDAVHDTLALLRDSAVEVVVLHVFDPQHMPAFLDQPHHALEAWKHEFLARHAGAGVRLELRAGTAGQHVLQFAEVAQVDLIALGWAQHFTGGHAAVVHDLLSHATTPILLVPVKGTRGEADLHQIPESGGPA